MVKGRKSGNTKPPSPHRQNWMLCSRNHCQNITVCENTKLKSSLLPFKVLIMDNGDLSTKSEYNNRPNINFPLHHTLNQVELNTNLQDEVILTKVVLRPTKKPKSVGPHKLILKKITTRKNHTKKIKN